MLENKQSDEKHAVLAEDEIKQKQEKQEKQEMLQSDFIKNMLRPVIVLTVVCIVASLLLALTNALTQPVIAANTQAAAQAARIALLPKADGFETVPPPQGVKNVTAAYRATNGVGWVIQAYGRGYAGQVPALVAFDENGIIAGVSFAENNETVGLGQKVRLPEFYLQFSKLEAQNINPGDVDKIASATISTNAAIAAVNAAIEAYAYLSGGAGAGKATNAQEALEFLLPGESLSPISIKAENVQETAYVSDEGNFIIFAETPKEGGKALIAAVAINPNGEIMNLWLDASSEGEAYGQTLASNQKYIGSYFGQKAPAKVDAVADITGSSNSVQSAVNSALNAWPMAREAA